ncbi:MAG: DUF3288 family protein [Cyanobacteria bacterium]|nr:DUF3288 family protein [Cyanobacteriota bacterium]MEB3267799.1 DUF3288 family protein [Leptolyngbya sp.]
MADTKDQQHPQYKGDRAIVNRLLGEAVSDHGLAELGRLLIRYKNFPGARDIQADLHKLLNHWGLTEAGLYERTRAIHAQGQVYRDLGRNREDWS